MSDINHSKPEGSLLLARIIMGAGVAFLMYFPINKHFLQPTPQEKAYSACKVFTLGQLHDPDSATFGDPVFGNEKTKPFAMTFAVYAKNGFGGMRKSHVECETMGLTVSKKDLVIKFKLTDA